MIEKARTEKELQKAKAPWPESEEELIEYIHSLVNREHDYGTCVYAMSLAAEAAFYYVSKQLGVTEFQASCADLTFIGNTRGIKGPFMLIKAEDALYPQCNPRDKFEEAMEKWKPWLKEEARKLLDERDGAAKRVVEHWKMLASQEIPVQG